MTTVTKPEFKAPSQVVEAHASPAIVSPAPLVGTWLNTNTATRDLAKVVITQSGNNLTVHAYGACSPKPCDWGPEPGIAYSAGVTAVPAEAFSAQYNFGFSKVILVGHLIGNLLNVETLTVFTDGSGRNAYYSNMEMKK
ncbi:MAG: hypothetical protein WBW33_31020 [Bryobacteraceae bacterium]